MDIESVLSHALGVSDFDLSATKGSLTAAKNAFVAVTRPRRFLAMRRSAVGASLDP